MIEENMRTISCVVVACWHGVAKSLSLFQDPNLAIGQNSH